MKSNPSNSATNKHSPTRTKKSESDLTWKSPLASLFRSPKTKTCEHLNQAGVQTLEDLLWLLPLHIYLIPDLQRFEKAFEGEVFTGQGKVVSCDSRPNFRVKGKRGIPLVNITLHVKDTFSENLLTLKWFNTYPSAKKKLEKIKYLRFSGMVQLYQGTKQIITPEYLILDEEDLRAKLPEPHERSIQLKVQYPTTNGVSSAQILKLFQKIPHTLWRNIPENLPSSLLEKRNLMDRSQAFRAIHGIPLGEEKWSQEWETKAKERLIYEELFIEQLKIQARRSREDQREAPKFLLNESEWDKLCALYPYDLTPDQKKVLGEIRRDFESARPMMRMIQGDVGCGKTSVALTAGLATLKSHRQVAFMCPTESLALQHFSNNRELLESQGFRCGLLLGSHKPKEKKEIQQQLLDGDIDFIFGTHSLIQESTEFHSLGLAIIDEQHKFGVDQRLQLIHKGEGTHALIMTATPIPRSLSLTQYGDLDVSIITQLPAGRKGIKTRIVTPDTFQKFLSFIKTRVSMGEQAYVVVPAITESPNKDILHLEQVEKDFKRYFPEFTIKGLHGQMKSEEKAQSFKEFQRGNIQILVSTSVIEVGINVLNATVMAIMSPERFGLSSLHQLRGRVGRGEKPGFCFLTLDKKVSQASMERLQVIEKHLDGFQIAEEDLKIRGEGNLFGVEQSGSSSQRKVSNIITNQSELLMAKEDIEELKNEGSTFLAEQIRQLGQDERIFSTV